MKQSSLPCLPVLRSPSAPCRDGSWDLLQPMCEENALSPELQRDSLPDPVSGGSCRMEPLRGALHCVSSPLGPGWTGTGTEVFCSVSLCPEERFAAMPAHGVWPETPSQGQLAGFSFNKAPQKLFTSLDFSLKAILYGGHPLKSQILSSCPSRRQRQWWFLHGMWIAVSKFT